MGGTPETDGQTLTALHPKSPERSKCASRSGFTNNLLPGGVSGLHQEDQDVTQQQWQLLLWVTSCH